MDLIFYICLLLFAGSYSEEGFEGAELCFEERDFPRFFPLFFGAVLLGGATWDATDEAFTALAPAFTPPFGLFLVFPTVEEDADEDEDEDDEEKEGFFLFLEGFFFDEEEPIPGRKLS